MTLGCYEMLVRAEALARPLPRESAVNQAVHVGGRRRLFGPALGLFGRDTGSEAITWPVSRVLPVFLQAFCQPKIRDRWRARTSAENRTFDGLRSRWITPP